MPLVVNIAIRFEVGTYHVLKVAGVPLGLKRENAKTVSRLSAKMNGKLRRPSETDNSTHGD